MGLNYHEATTGHLQLCLLRQPHEILPFAQSKSIFSYRLFASSGHSQLPQSPTGWMDMYGGETLVFTRSGSVFRLLLGVSSGYAEVTCSVIGQAQPELIPSKRRKTGPGQVWCPQFIPYKWLHSKCFISFSLVSNILRILQLVNCKLITNLSNK